MWDGASLSKNTRTGKLEHLEAIHTSLYALVEGQLALVIADFRSELPVRRQ